MARTVSRKAQGVRRQARAAGTQRQVRAARARSTSLFDTLMRYLPFTEEQLHRFFIGLIVLGGLVLALFVANISGATAMAQQQFSAMAANAGFEVRRVEVRGVKRMNEMKVYERALGQRDQAMPNVDLHALRASLLELPWVADARVSRQLPDELVIDIVERTPHAALKKPDRLVLIDPSGHELEPISKAAAAKMLLIEGPGAQAQVEALTALLDAAPALRSQVVAAEWVGNRRWNLTFKTDQKLALPQGEDRAAGALISFARLDGVNRLIGGKVAAFDMRSPERIYLRVPDREAQAIETGEGS